MKGYFVVYLNDGFRFDFNEQCNQVDYSDSNVMCFRRIDSKNDTKRLLAAIPYENIKYVLNVEKDEEEGGE